MFRGMRDYIKGVSKKLVGRKQSQLYIIRKSLTIQWVPSLSKQEFWVRVWLRNGFGNVGSVAYHLSGFNAGKSILFCVSQNFFKQLEKF